jgi:hypothetical protein
MMCWRRVGNERLDALGRGRAARTHRAAAPAAAADAVSGRPTCARARLVHTARMRWDPEAEARLKKAPFFIRPFIKGRAEKAAKERGLEAVTTGLLDELKSKEHRG